MKKINIAAVAVIASTICEVAWPTGAIAEVVIVDSKDTLDKAVAGPDLIGGTDENSFAVHVGDREQYDSNVFRLSSGTDIATTVGPRAAKQDSINSPSAGLDTQWGIGRQSIGLSLSAQDNRYDKNTNLNNVSSADRLVWNWGLGGVLLGQVGVNYLRGLAGFVNATSYTRNIYQQENAFAASRYQLGPHWSIYGGVLESGFALAGAGGNNSRSKSVDFGVDLVTDLDNTFGLDYRYTDSRYPNGVALGGSTFNPDFREDRVRFLVKRILTDKTSLDLSVGSIKRTYGNSTIGSFSGVIWRASLGWQPSEKTQFVVATWRNLQAYLTDQTNYYRSTGANIAPTWNPTEKVGLSLSISRDAQSYIGSSPIAINQSARRDTVNGESAGITYAATRALTFDAGLHHERRTSNVQLHTYTDNYASAGVKFVF